jgi:ABC-2 type transport system permease protein
MSQAYGLLSDTGAGNSAARSLQRLAASPWLAPDSACGCPAAPSLGEPLPMLGMAVLGLAAFALTVGRTHRFFVHGLQQAASSARATFRPAGAVGFRFRRSLFDTVVVKEWRLIARDPHLLSQVLLQLVYLVPLLFLIMRKNEAPRRRRSAPACLAVQLAERLAGLDHRRGRGRARPAAVLAGGRTHDRLAKLAAPVMPPLLLVALPLLWLMVRAPLAGVLIGFVVVAAVLSAALIVRWQGRPAKRSDFKMRGKENFLCSIFEALNTLCWGGLGWLLVSLAAESGVAAGSTALMAAARSCRRSALAAAGLVHAPALRDA